LIEDPEQEEKVLTAQLRDAGLYAANILGGASTSLFSSSRGEMLTNSALPPSFPSVDGNCLFRALSDQLYGSPSMHLAIRNEVSHLFLFLSFVFVRSLTSSSLLVMQICDYLSQNADRYRFFIDEDSVKNGFDGHVREMRQPGALFSHTDRFLLPLIRLPNATGTYGTNIELSAFVARYRRPVKVYQPNLVYVLPVEEGDVSSPSADASASSPSSSSSPLPLEDIENQKLTPREKRIKAREEKEQAKGGKGKGKQAVKQWVAPELQAFDGTPLCIVCVLSLSPLSLSRN
jgi:OTU domain-containing protein 3